MEKENQYLRLGVYGGTFSPPHLGHIHAAEVFLSQGGIDSLLIIPTHQTPMKEREESTSPEHRLAMCRLAFSFSPYITVSDIEVRRGGKSYTAETLTELSAPGVRLSYLCGTDMLLSMGRWYRPQVIFDLADIVCMRRECDMQMTQKLLEATEEYRTKYGARVRFLDAEPMQLSSTDVRRLVSEGEDLRKYLSADVYEYIKEKGLYV